MADISSNRGAALALVLALLAAISIAVGGLVAISRDEVNFITARIDVTKAFYTGQGLARLALQERAQGLAEPQDRRASSDNGSFVIEYVLDDVSARIEVLDANGFVSLTNSDPETWLTLLTGLGGMDELSAIPLSQTLAEGQVLGRAGVSPTSRTSFAAAREQLANGSRGTGAAGGFVESLLGKDGMTRDVYDRVKRSVSSYSRAGAPHVASLPTELQGLFGEDNPEENLSDVHHSAYLCVEVRMKFPSGNTLSQRLWVRNVETAGVMGFEKVERPVFIADSAAQGVL